jgi:hypothetical protein
MPPDAHLGYAKSRSLRFPQAEEEFNREKSLIQDRLAQELVERQKRSAKVSCAPASHALGADYFAAACGLQLAYRALPVTLASSVWAG